MSIGSVYQILKETQISVVSQTGSKEQLAMDTGYLERHATTALVQYPGPSYYPLMELASHDPVASQSHELGTKPSTHEVCGNILHLNHTSTVNLQKDNHLSSNEWGVCGVCVWDYRFLREMSKHVFSYPLGVRMP